MPNKKTMDQKRKNQDPTARQTAQNLSRRAVSAGRRAVARQPAVRAASAVGRTAARATARTRSGVSADVRAAAREIRKWTG